jgi:hypothetical protein
MSEATISINLGARRTVSVILDIVTAQNLLLALTNALQGGSGKKKKKGDKGGKGVKGAKVAGVKGLKGFKVA